MEPGKCEALVCHGPAYGRYSGSHVTGIVTEYRVRRQLHPVEACLLYDRQRPVQINITEQLVAYREVHRSPPKKSKKKVANISKQFYNHTTFP